MLKVRNIYLFCLVVLSIVGANERANEGAYWVTLKGQVLSIPLDDLWLLGNVHPGDPVYYRFLADFDRVIPPRGPGGPPRDTTIDKYEYFFDSLAYGSHFQKPIPVVSETTNGEKVFRDQAATTYLRYFAGDFKRVLGIEAKFNDSPTLAPELWVGRSGTVVETYEAIDLGKKCLLFASMKVTEVKKLMPVSLQNSSPTVRTSPRSGRLSLSARNALGRLMISQDRN